MAENSAVSVRRLTVRRGAHIALHGVDATIPRGSSTVLVGPNGAGKTTFLLSLLGELPHSGQIDILPLNGRAPRISFVPQYANPAARMPLTAAEFLSLDGNRRPLWLGLGRAARRRAATDTAGKTTLSRFAAKKFNSFLCAYIVAYYSKKYKDRADVFANSYIM